jgi:aryl-alcohol dehydrogenase-like predicted oxidoreductase
MIFVDCATEKYIREQLPSPVCPDHQPLDIFIIAHFKLLLLSRSYIIFSTSTTTMAPLTRTLGKNGPSLPAIGFGLMSIGGTYGAAPSDEERTALLDHAHAIGEHFWDTADIYADSEDAVGLWVKQNPAKRKDIFLATKFGIQFDPATYTQTLRCDPEYIKEACERSLKRLNTDWIDLYYCHRVDGKTPIEKTVEAMVELKKYSFLQTI